MLARDAATRKAATLTSVRGGTVSFLSPPPLPDTIIQRLERPFAEVKPSIPLPTVVGVSTTSREGKSFSQPGPLELSSPSPPPPLPPPPPPPPPLLLKLPSLKTLPSQNRASLPAFAPGWKPKLPLPAVAVDCSSVPFSDAPQKRSASSGIWHYVPIDSSEPPAKKFQGSAI
jgi:hypothetical protein